MSAASLITKGDSFEFEHSMAHRLSLGGMHPLDRFSAIPYFVDPYFNETSWYQDHQQAHNDSGVTLPGIFGYSRDPITGQTYPLAIQQLQILTDMDLSNPDIVPWWTFANHQEHYVANQVLPLHLTYPFW